MDPPTPEAPIRHATVPQTPYQAVFVPPTAGLAPHGVPRQTTPTQIPALRFESSGGLPTAGRGRGVLSLGLTDSSTPDVGRRPEDEETVSETLPGSRKHTSRRDRRGPVQSAYRPYEPKELATCRSEGWKKDTHRIYGTHLSKTSPHITPTEAEAIIEPVLEHM